jgi:hypothetical protein
MLAEMERRGVAKAAAAALLQGQGTLAVAQLRLMGSPRQLFSQRRQCWRC